MAKDSSTLRARAGQVRVDSVSVPEFISQAEIVNVLYLRAQYSMLKQRLFEAQQAMLHKLEQEAQVEYGGFYACKSTNMQLVIWEGDSLKVL